MSCPKSLVVALAALVPTFLSACSASAVDEASGNASGGPGAPGSSAPGEMDPARADAGKPVPPPVTIRRPGASDVLADGPQYLAVRKSQTELPDAAHEARCKQLLPKLAALPFLGNAHTCAIFNPYVLDSLADRASRRDYFAAGLEEPRVMLGRDAVGNRRLAVEVMLDLLDAPVAKLEEFVDGILDGARVAKMPVLFNLDATNWWGGRPDLWNFFDPKKPGFDPKNVANVEWAGPTAENAPRVYWRNWGSQIRVETPVPNLASPSLRAAIQQVLDRIAPKLRAYAEELPPDQRYLYAGTIIGTELAIGVNHYHYPNGNAYLADDPKCDPGLPYAAGCAAPPPGICQSFNRSVCPPSFELAPSGGVAQLGFHAGRDLGVLTGNAAPNRAVLDRIVNSYVGFLQQAIAGAGLPPSKIYSHTGGTFGPNGPHSLDAAATPGVIPGWSMYFDGAQNPLGSIGPFIETEARRALPWSSPEWLPLDPNGGSSAATWSSAIESSLNYRNNRMLSVANWEGISTSPGAVGGLAQSLTTPRFDACVVMERSVLGAARFTDGTAVRFSGAPPGTVTYLNVSTSDERTAIGTLAKVDVANEELDPATLVKVFAAGGAAKVYVQLATDGCTRNGAASRMLSPIVAIDVGGGTEPTGPLRLFADRGHRIATLSWDGAVDPTATIELSYRRDFAKLESTPVKDGRVLYTDGFDARSPLYARMRSGAVLSNVVELK